MTILSVTYNQLKNAKVAFVTKFTAVYTEDINNSKFRVCGIIDGQNVCLSYNDIAKPVAFDSDFPNAIKVESINHI